jgi:periplasmic protein CpxP/Spy
MRRILTILAALSFWCAGLAHPAFAQDKAPAPASDTQFPSPDQVVDLLATKLALSDEQKSQIRPIIADRQQKIAALRADTSLRKGKRLRQIKSVLDDGDRRIKAILNQQQQAQYAQVEQQMRQQLKQRLHERGSAGSPQ